MLASTVNQLSLLAAYPGDFRKRIHYKLKTVIVDRNDVVLHKGSAEKLIYLLRRPEQRVVAVDSNHEVLDMAPGGAP